MRVSLIVPTRNSARTLAACLESCNNQTHEDVEVIVVDNSSTDGTVEIAHELADLVLDQKPERSAQRNRGAAESTGDIVVFIDSDMVLEPTVVADFVEVFERRPEVGAVIIPESTEGSARARSTVNRTHPRREASAGPRSAPSSSPSGPSVKVSSPPAGCSRRACTWGTPTSRRRGRSAVRSSKPPVAGTRP